MKKMFLFLFLLVATNLFCQECYHNEVDKQFIIVSSDSIKYHYRSHNYGQFGYAESLSNKRLKTKNDLMYKIDGEYLVVSKFGIPPVRISKLIRRECTKDEINLFEMLFD